MAKPLIYWEKKYGKDLKKVDIRSRNWNQVQFFSSTSI